jgi:hypothetical protein
MPAYSFYSVATGLLVGQTFTGPAEFLGANTPPGCAAVAGLHDHLSRRVVAGAVVDYQPPKPADTAQHVYAWNASTRRWVATLTPGGLAVRANEPIKAQLVATEQASLRSMREALLLPPGAARDAALGQLSSADASASALRNQLQLEP